MSPWLRRIGTAVLGLGVLAGASLWIGITWTQRRIQDILSTSETRWGVALGVQEIVVRPWSLTLRGLSIGNGPLATVQLAQLSPRLVRDLVSGWGIDVQVQLHGVVVRGTQSEFQAMIAQLRSRSSPISRNVTSKPLGDKAPPAISSPMRQWVQRLESINISIDELHADLLDPAGSRQFGAATCAITSRLRLSPSAAGEALIDCQRLTAAGVEVQGPFSVRVVRDKGRDQEWSLEVKDAQDSWQIKAQGQAEQGELALHLERGLPPLITHFLPGAIDLSPSLGPHDLAVSLSRSSAEPSRWKFDMHGVSHDLLLHSRHLSDMAVGPKRWQIKGRGELDPQARWIKTDAFEVSFSNDSAEIITDAPEAVVLRGRGRVQGATSPNGLWQLDLDLNLEPMDCQALLNSLPGGLVPALRGFDLTGQFGGAISLTLNSRTPETFDFSLRKLAAGCRVRSAPPGFRREDIASIFPPEVVEASGGKPRRPVAAMIRRIAKHFGPILPSAVVAAEDGGFWHHAGIDWGALEAAARRNLAAGVIRGGASTITMQTIKNLFFSHERTVGRKVQEAFLAWYVEGILTKDEILWVYLSIAEFGPGLFGIAPAARYYFGKDSRMLTPGEALFLASLLPSPVKRHRHACQGTLRPASTNDGYGKLLRMLGGRLVDAGVLTAQGLEGALAQTLVFAPNPLRRSNCQRKSSKDYDVTSQPEILEDP